eukprot:641862-Pyramimonas_sp.AAC.1
MRQTRNSAMRQTRNSAMRSRLLQHTCVRTNHVYLRIGPMVTGPIPPESNPDRSPSGADSPMRSSFSCSLSVLA